MEETPKVQVPEEYDLDDVIIDPPSVTVVLGAKSKTFWIRPPTDPEKAMAQAVARKKSRELRARLEDPENEEHQLLVVDEMENLTTAEMRLIWLTSNLFQKTFEINRRSLDDREDFFVPSPEGSEDGVIPPTNEDMDRYEQAKIDSEGDRLEAIAKQQQVAFKELQDKSEEIPEDDLRNLIHPLIIDQQASREWSAQYGMQIIVRCTFLDKELTKKAFETPERALRLQNSTNGQKILDELSAAHSGLMLDPDRLKN